MTETTPSGRPTRSAEVTVPPIAWRPVTVLLVAVAAALTALSGRYGLHRDEFYYLAAGKHLAWGYADQPVLTPALARLSTVLFGETPMGMRVVATLCGVGTVVLSALAARELGGGRVAQLFTGLATALSSYVLVVSHMLSTTTVDLLVWVAFSVVMLRLLRTGDGRWWLPAGVVAGVGIENKWLVLVLCAAWAVALLVVGPREVLRSRWLAAGIVAGALLAAPSVVWQITHGWPMLSLASGISGSDGFGNRVSFVPLQLVYLSPVLVPVMIAGARRVWREPGLRWARAGVLAYPIVAVAVLVAGGKAYYALPPLIVLLAAGAPAGLGWLTGGPGARRVVNRVLAGIGVLVSVVIGLPLLGPGQLGPVLAVNKEAGEQVGWPELVGTVAGAWFTLPADQRATAVIFTENYGQAGAIDLYGHGDGLPRVYSGHMSYADWGAPADGMTGPVLVVGQPVTIWFRDCQVVTVFHNPQGTDNEENGVVISRCAHDTWSALWPSLRHGY
jgi:4-amino-4-deoxy-L-arabinose transferase-like glycosyltransferase